MSFRSPRIVYSLRCFSVRPLTGPGPSPHSFAIRPNFVIAPPGLQAFTLGGFYSEMLLHPLKDKYAFRRPYPSAQAKQSVATPAQRAKLVFGSRIAGPIHRREPQLRKAKNIAGVLVPPKPQEPDNCCMSGCATCVWDTYREDVEDWLTRRSAADKALEQLRRRTSGSLHQSIDSQRQLPTDHKSVFDSIPVGIRQFMELEKRLKKSA